MSTLCPALAQAQHLRLLKAQTKQTFRQPVSTRCSVSSRAAMQEGEKLETLLPRMLGQQDGARTAPIDCREPTYEPLSSDNLNSFAMSLGSLPQPQNFTHFVLSQPMRDSQQEMTGMDMLAPAFSGSPSGPPPGQTLTLPPHPGPEYTMPNANASALTHQSVFAQAQVPSFSPMVPEPPSLTGILPGWDRPTALEQLLNSPMLDAMQDHNLWLPGHNPIAMQTSQPPSQTEQHLHGGVISSDSFSQHPDLSLNFTNHHNRHHDLLRLPRISQDPLSPTQAAVQHQFWQLCAGGNSSSSNTNPHQRQQLKLFPGSSGQLPGPNSAMSVYDAGARLHSLEQRMSTDLIQLPSHAETPAMQAWLEWHVGDRRSSVGPGSWPLSASLTGLLSSQALPSQINIQDEELTSANRAMAIPSNNPQPTYCPNCTMPLNDNDSPSPSPRHGLPTTSGHLPPPLLCPRCHRPPVAPLPTTTSSSLPGPTPAPVLAPALPILGSPVSPVMFSTEPQGATTPDMSAAAGVSGSILGPLPPGSSPGSPGAMAGTAGPDQLTGLEGPPGTVLGYDDQMLAHSEPPSRWGREHPERPNRLVAIMQCLNNMGLIGRCKQISGRPATDAELSAVHEPELIKHVAAASSAAARARGMQPDTNEPTESIWESSRWIVDCPVNESTNTAARIAAGVAIDAAVAVATGRAKNGAAIIRPPGHHAESALSMGFCIFNNVAVAARAAQKAGAQRVLIMDWDVHHGNGTAHAFQDDTSVLFISTHRWDGGYFFPGTGSPREVGSGQGQGYTVNVAWDGPGVTDADCLLAFRHVIMPIAQAFAPDLVLVSAGFDAARGDPLGECLLSPALYGNLTHMLSSLAPIALLLEGGYNLAATAECTAECVRVLLDGTPQELVGPKEPSRSAIESVMETLEAHQQYWAEAREQLQVLRAQQPPSSPPATPDNAELLSGLDARLLSINELEIDSDPLGGEEGRD